MTLDDFRKLVESSTPFKVLKVPDHPEIVAFALELKGAHPVDITGIETWDEDIVKGMLVSLLLDNLRGILSYLSENMQLKDPQPSILTPGHKVVRPFQKPN